MEWWLVRHGLTTWNLDRKYQGHSDTELLPGEASGLSSLRGRLSGVDFSGVYCSDLRRCRDTLEYLRPDLSASARYDRRLREMNFGEWEGRTYELLKDNPAYRAWIDHPQSVTPPGGEPWNDFERRVREIYEEFIEVTCRLNDRDKNTPNPMLIVTHGGVISMLGMLLKPGTGDFWNDEYKIATGEVLKVKVGGS